MTAPADAPRERDGIAIRPYRAGDADALFATVSASLASLAQWLPWARAGYTRDDAQAWIAQCESRWRDGGGFHFGIFDIESCALLGATGLSRCDPERRSANLGYWVADAARGRGVAVAAARLAARFGFDELGLARIEILALPENRPSLRVAAKLGALREGVARNGLMVAGTACDAIVHALIPGDLLPKDQID